MRQILCRNGTSTVVTLIPAGFHLLLFHPSTHIAPRLNKLTVPSPSPIFTPLRTYGTTISDLGKHRYVLDRGTLGFLVLSVYSLSIQLGLCRGRSRGDLVISQFCSSPHAGCSVSARVSSCSYWPRVYLLDSSQEAFLHLFPPNTPV